MSLEQGREDRKDNDLFFTCGLIDYIARKTKNTRATVVEKLGKERLSKIYDLADVYHCDNIDKVSTLFRMLKSKQGILIMWLYADMRFLLIGILEKYISG